MRTSQTITATVSPVVTTGKATFYDRVTVLGFRTLSMGQATLTAALLPFPYFLALILIFAAVAGPRAQAQSDFWKSKKPADWSEAEVRRVISDSPWAKLTKVRTKLDSPGRGSGGLSQAPHGAQPPTMRGPGIGGPGTGPGIVFTSPDMDHIPGQTRFVPLAGFGKCIGDCTDIFGNITPTQVVQDMQKAVEARSGVKAKTNSPVTSGGILLPEDSVLVVWDSATPVREAKVRLHIKDAAVSSSGQYFVIAVIGYPLNLEGRSKEWIKDSAYVLRKGNERSRPSDIDVVGTGDLATVRFYFSREEGIQPGEREVLFYFLLGSILVETKFFPGEMTYQGRPAF